jgi:SAM-dependent methyltransferase
MELKNTANAEYSTLPSTSFIKKLAASQRRKMFDAFTAFRGDSVADTILNVRMAPSPQFEGESHLLEWSDAQTAARITSWEIAPPVRGAGSFRLPFSDGQFDWVYCNEAIERAGGFDRQLELVKELNRVARKGVFVTTSNRRHPIEFNTGMPLLHMLPDAWWRRILKLTGKEALASESAFNPVDSGVLYRIASLLPGKPAHDVGHKRIMGIKAHFFLMLEKQAR